MELSKLVESGRTIRAIGIDDAHYADKTRGSTVNVAGVVCGGTRFEGMLWSHLTKDGLDSTDRVLEMIGQSKFWAQLHVVLLDGITFGGGNVIDIVELSERLKLRSSPLCEKCPTSFSSKKCC